MSINTDALTAFPFARPAADTAPCEYARLRRESPVSRVALWDGNPAWLVVGHKAVRQVLGGGDGSGMWSKVSSAERPVCDTAPTCRPSAHVIQDRRQPGFPEMTAAGKAAAKGDPTFVYMDEPERGRDRCVFLSSGQHHTRAKVRY